MMSPHFHASSSFCLLCLPTSNHRKPTWSALQRAAVAELLEQRLLPISDADAATVRFLCICVCVCVCL